MRAGLRERLLGRTIIDLSAPRPIDESPCWRWTAALNAQGYGRFRDSLAHRAVYELLSAPIPEGTELDHLCRNRSCVNPAHLEPVVHAENCRRGVAGKSARERMLAKTHCARGHEWTPENTKQTQRQRKCRACIREDSANARARRKVQAA